MPDSVSTSEMILRGETARLQQLLRMTTEALESAIETIKTWHGIQFVGRAADDPGRNLDKKAWEIYRTHAPEMKLLYAAIAKAKGEAL